MSATATPAMRQYLDAKQQHRDAILFFRMGDFFEMFYEDALVAARALELTLTSRSKDADGGGIPMCGVPHHAVDGYIARLVQNGPLILYSFTNPDETLQLRLGENSSRLDVVTEGGTEKFAGSKLNEKIRGTGLTYEDLAFKFLYWPTAHVLGEDNVRTRKCWKLQLRAPSREPQYSNMLLWIDKASGALMRMEGYDWNSQLAKRFEVVSAQKIEGRWFLKQMRVEEFQPGTSHVQARTYLEIKR